MLDWPERDLPILEKKCVVCGTLVIYTAKQCTCCTDKDFTAAPVEQDKGG